MEIKSLILDVLKEPTIFHDCIGDWPALGWDLKHWSSIIGNRLLPFRCGLKKYSEKPQWEAGCTTKELTLDQFCASLESQNNTEEWCYFDYKHMIEWFRENSDVMDCVNWSAFGFPERGGNDSTLWISSKEAHTPCHIDTYGCNLVAQILGRKQWIFFPPNCKNLKPTRVPYEESSIYSEINFYSPPKDLMLQGACVVTLNPGDVLFVPAGWWHYVETVSTAAISINTWIPLPGDQLKKIEEAVVKTLVSSLVRLTPSSSSLLNPNEIDMREDPNILEYLRLAVNQYEETLSEEPCIKKARLTVNECRNSKSSDEPIGKTPGTDSAEESECALKVNMNSVNEMSLENFHALMEQKRLKFDIIDEPKPTQTEHLQLCKNLINVICDQQIISSIATKLIQKR